MDTFAVCRPRLWVNAVLTWGLHTSKVLNKELSFGNNLQIMQSLLATKNFPLSSNLDVCTKATLVTLTYHSSLTTEVSFPLLCGGSPVLQQKKIS